MPGSELPPSGSPTQASLATSPTASAAPGTATRYAAGRVIGRGGMGEVALCHDQLLDRDVARKTVRHGSRERFVREARLQARLDHPAIVPLFDAGELEDGSPWFTMRHVSGRTLQEVLGALARGDEQAQSRWTRRRLLTDFVRVAEAIRFAHERGIVHRDIKPANVILCDFGEVYVLDWGVARSETDVEATTEAMPGVTSGDLTVEGSMIGTLGYMAPEQMRDATRIDGRADVYSLGAVLFEILALQPLHPEREPEALVKSTLDGADARACHRAPEREVPPELEAICVRATALEPGDRYPDVAGMLADLERFLDGDRDLERRRALAADHVARAATLLADAHDRFDVRAEAMRETARALAFDPTHEGARLQLGRLLLEPPKHVPAEVERSLREDNDTQARAQARTGGMIGVAWLAWVGVVVAMGIRSWVTIGGIVVMMVLIIVSARRHSRRAVSEGDVLLVFAMLGCVIALTTRLFGPLVLVPGVVAGMLAMFMLNASLRAWPFIAIACASFTLPWLAELVGVLPRSYEFSGDAWTTRASMTDFPPVLTEIALWLGSILTVIANGVGISRNRRIFDEARRSLRLHAWHLDQLVPRERAA